MRREKQLGYRRAARRMPLILVACLAPPVALIAAALPAAAADQLVAFDETYVQQLNGNVSGETFHWGIVPKPTEPASWVTPVDYSKGTAYLYMEVLEKPSKRNTTLTVCFDGPKEGYGCFTSKAYTDVGAFETKVAMGGAGWYQYNQIAWGKRRDDYHLVIKDPALGGTQGGKPASDYVPTKLRVVLTVVPAGASYVPPLPGAGFDAGAGAASDAGAAPGSGGSGGGAAEDAAPGPSEKDAAAPATPPDSPTTTPTQGGTGGSSSNRGGATGSTGTGGSGPGAGGVPAASAARVAAPPVTRPRPASARARWPTRVTPRARAPVSCCWSPPPRLVRSGAVVARGARRKAQIRDARSFFSGPLAPSAGRGLG